MQEKPSNINKLVYFIISVIFLIGFNLYSSTYLSNISQEPILLFPGIKLNYMENTGAAFSILQDYKICLIIFAIAAIILILWYLIKNISELSMMVILMVSLLITGVGCNLYERLAFGFVRDYFELTFVNFPVFNISDIFINVSVIVIMFMLITKNYAKK